MFVRQAKFPGDENKSHNANKQDFRYPKAIIQSIDNPELMEKESSRARLINQLVEPQHLMPREFSSYFLGPTDTTDPAYLVTSHADDPQIQKPVLSTYPLVQDLRWNFHVETSTIPECEETPVEYDEKKEQHDVAERKYTCKCKNCTNLCCPSRAQSFKPAFKDNIMTFCDKCTMTVKQNNAGCGGQTPVSCSPVVSEVSVTTSDIAVRDTANQMPHQYPLGSQPSRHRVKSYPTPILKKPLHHPIYSHYDCATRSPILIDMEAERDISEPCYPVFDSPCRKSLNDHYANRKSGRTLYNEGINNLRVYNQPLYPQGPVSVVKRERSRVPIASKSNNYNDRATTLPYAHRTDSKYHYACMEQPDKHRRHEDGEDRRGILASPRITRKTYECELQHDRPTSCALPKRVLSSNLDIEKFLENNCCKMMQPKKAKFFTRK